MARARSPNRKLAEKIYLESNGTILLKQIAEQLGVSDSQIRKWKNQDKWDEKLNGNVTNGNSNVTKRKGAPKGNKNGAGHGPPKGNKNAKGNTGGGAPSRNTNAVKTGEYQTLWMDALTPEQQEIVERVNLDPLEQINQSITLYAWREREIMMKIAKLEKGLTEKQRRVLQERVNIKEPVQVHDEKSGKPKTVILTRNELATTKIEETEYRVIEDILNLQEALTRVTDKKLRAVEMKHKLIIDEDGDDDGDGLESLSKAIEESRRLLAGDD
ncbi:phage terminase small subunit-related protein [Brevibacillus halotolerans]|uniref:phage terminase small subunit-related protein n=1 Tax=Brevibacillus TaxID=55080 RepID=UPI00215CA3B4|nr:MULTISPECIES: phage terminase small subunit-related protein [Brevibacillus]MCR8961649.1 phage terminase small subunit-related protein [Brevibacillus laterosporus]MCZ0833804.1 phage terminase small subunit-related protein [Brevibacillus halotolerans]